MKLLDILTYTRKHESKTEAKFINNYLIPKINELGYKPTMDAVGNIWVEVAPKKEAPYLFVAHIDTCHQREGYINPIVEGHMVRMNPADVNHGCLGADDGVGIYCNLRMIEAGIKGTYLFTRGEEKGGIGAAYIAKSTPEKLEGFLMSVEVDRAGTDEVIIAQSYGECASEAFGDTLGEAIGMGHKSSYMGVYTDVSEFADIIPENVNLSAGYDHQHTVKETVNLVYVESLIDSLLDVDWSSLPIKRTPGDYGEPETGWWNYRQYDTLTEYDRLLSYIEDYPEKVAYYLSVIGVDQYEMEHEWNDSTSSPFEEDKLAVGL